MNEQIERAVIAICKLLHPQDLGKETSILENKIREEVEHMIERLKPKKIKSWVVYCDEYPNGMVWDDRADALESSQTCRDEGCSAYVRVKYFTQKERDELPEGD